MMSDFEFTSVVVSILIAFAFSEVLSSWGRIIKRRKAVDASGLYFGTSALLLLALVGHWLGLSEYRELPAISSLEALLIFAPSFLAAFVAFLLAPEFTGDDRLDLSAHYFAVAPWVFPLLAAFAVLAGLSDRVVLGKDIIPFWFYIARAAVLLVPAFTVRVSAHAAVLAISLLAPLGLGAVALLRGA